MSRAFVKEPDAELPEKLPELSVSEHPNYVTARGLAQLRDRAARLEAAQGRLDGGEATRAHRERELRWLHARVGGAILTQPQPEQERVAFGATVSVTDEEGVAHTYSIVGEDEAEPEEGLVSWTSPLAKALLGARVGEEVVWRRPAGAHTLEIVSIA